MPLVADLQKLPDLAIQILVAGVLTLLCIAAPFAGRHLARLRANDVRDTAAFDAFKAVMNVFAIVLAFSMVQSITNLRNAEAMVGREASALSAVDRALTRFGTPEATALRPALAAYGESRIETEWRLMSDGLRSDETDQKFRALSRPARALQPADTRQSNMQAELLRSLEDLAEAREVMLAATGTGLPAPFYTTALALLVIALVMAAGTVTTAQRLLGLGAFGAAVGLLLAFVLIMDRPFSGESAVSPAPIATILRVNASRV